MNFGATYSLITEYDESKLKKPEHSNKTWEHAAVMILFPSSTQEVNPSLIVLPTASG